MEATEGMSRNEEIAQIVAEAASDVPAEAVDEAPVAIEAAEDAPEAAPVGELAPVVTPEPAAAPDRSWKAIEDREQGLVAREKALKAELDGFRAEQQRYTGKPTVDDFASKYANDPMAAIAELKLDPTKLIEAYVNADDPTPDYLHQKATGEVKKVEDRLQQLEQQLQTERAQNQAMSWQRSAADVLKGEAYDKVRKFSALDGVDPELLAFQVANRYAQTNGRFLTADEACDKLKVTLDERWDKAFPSDAAPSPAPKAKGVTGALTNDLSEPAPASIAMHPKNRREEIEEILKTAKF